MSPRPDGSKDVQALLKTLDIDTQHPQLYQQALIHRSILNETGQALESNERLEFLGDSVLGLIVADYLYEHLPGLSEGQLAKRKSSLVSATSLAAWSRELGLGGYLRLGKGEELSGGRDKETLLADGFEAVLGAVYLDQGIRGARRLVERLLKALPSEGLGKGTGDAKSRLQEWCQKVYKKPPVYRLAGTSGPDHAKVFEIEVVVGERVVAQGKGKNKKEAEQAGAEAALGDLEGKAK